MPYLDCVVTNCLYNEDKCCCKSDILVEGKDAHTTEQTCCGSYAKRREGEATSAAKCVDKETDVCCEACKCVFNDNRKCTAEHIGIAGSQACHCKETECASFCCD